MSGRNRGLSSLIGDVDVDLVDLCVYSYKLLVGVRNLFRFSNVVGLSVVRVVELRMHLKVHIIGRILDLLHLTGSLVRTNL